MPKKPLPLRIDEDLLRRVDERRGVLGQTRTLFVERALESALNTTVGGVTASESPAGAGSASSRASANVSQARRKAEVALEVRDAVRKRNAEKTYSCPKPNCIFVSSGPGVCVHHRTERLR